MIKLHLFIRLSIRKETKGEKTSQKRKHLKRESKENQSLKNMLRRENTITTNITQLYLNRIFM